MMSLRGQSWFCSLSLKLTTTSGFTRLGGLLHRLSGSPRISSAPPSSSQEEKLLFPLTHITNISTHMHHETCSTKHQTIGRSQCFPLGTGPAAAVQPTAFALLHHLSAYLGSISSVLLGFFHLSTAMPLIDTAAEAGEDTRGMFSSSSALSKSYAKRSSAWL